MTFSYQLKVSHLHEGLWGVETNVLSVLRVGLKACKSSLDTKFSVHLFMCSSNVRLHVHISSPLRIQTTRSAPVRDDQPAARPRCAPHCLFMWPGHKNQSADYKLCRSMCSSVREAQCFSLDRALAKLALLQSQLRTRLCSKGAAALL